MSLTVQEQGKAFEQTEKIGRALFLGKVVLRQCYALKKEFIRMHPNVHDSVDHPSLVPMDLSVRSIATPENVEEHLKQMHTALRHCLGLLVCYIEKDEQVRGKKNDLLASSSLFVQIQLAQLIKDTKDLMTGDGPHLDTTPYPPEQCTSEAHAQMSNFDFLVFAYRLLDELPVWMQLLVRNLIVFRQKTEEQEMEKIKPAQ